MLDRIPATPPEIPVLHRTTNDPLWSVMVPTYNCITYLKDALKSILIQDEGVAKMQIEVVDDCSTDGDVEKLVQEIGKGRVCYYKQETNKGSLRNFETCINRAKGQYIHILHGDDLVKNGFYKEAENIFERYPAVGSVITNYSKIDAQNIEGAPEPKIMSEAGIINDWLSKIASKQWVQPPAVVVKRTVYEKLGSFYAVEFGEDWEMWIRIAAHFPVAYSPKCLACYRGGHQTNISSRSIATGQNFKDLNTVIKITEKYLPPESRTQLKNEAKKYFSIIYAKASNRLYDLSDNKHAAFVQAHGSLNMHLNVRSIYWVIKMYGKHLKHRFGFNVKNNISTTSK